MGREGQARAYRWSCELGEAGLWAEMDFEDRSLKSQMKRADRLGAPWTLIVGERELAEGRAILRNMQTKAQQHLAMDGLAAALQQILKR